jgi:SAM-dependent methyltransferase
VIDNPAYYQLHHKNEMEDLPFWMELAGESAGLILELGCGTGRLLIPLIIAGYDVVGIDMDFRSLTYLKGQLSDQLVERVMIYQSEMENFQIAKKFSLIFLACNTLSAMEGSSRQKVYSKVHDHLFENGVFAFSIPNPSRLASLPKEGDPEVETSFSHPLTGNPVQVSSGWQRADQYVLFRWYYDHLLPDGQVERATIEIKQSLARKEDYLEGLRAANLLPSKIYGDFKKSDYQQNSPYLIIIARNGPGF